MEKQEEKATPKITYEDVDIDDHLEIAIYAGNQDISINNRITEEMSHPSLLESTSEVETPHSS